MNTRLRLLLILFGALLVATTYTFPYWQPYLATNPTEEGFPGLPDSLQTAFQQIPPDEQAAFLSLAEENPEQAISRLVEYLSPPAEVPEGNQSLPDMEGPTVVARGEFSRVSPIQWAEGTITIYEVADQSKVLRFEGFRSPNGPELHVILSEHPQPVTQAEVETNNTNIDLGRLQGSLGNQNYSIPPEVDIAQYQSIVIYSETFDVVYSYATLS